MEHSAPTVNPRLTTCLFDLCAAVQASERDEYDRAAEAAVIDHLLRRAWWEGEGGVAEPASEVLPGLRCTGAFCAASGRRSASAPRVAAHPRRGRTAPEAA